MVLYMHSLKSLGSQCVVVSALFVLIGQLLFYSSCIVGSYWLISFLFFMYCWFLLVNLYVIVFVELPQKEWSCTWKVDELVTVVPWV